MKIIAFDIGTKHFAWYAEKFDGNSSLDFGIRINCGVKNISSSCEVKVINKLISLLNELKPIILKCNIVLIEKQFCNKFAANIKALKLASSLCTWLLCNGTEENKIKFVNASFKTKGLGAPILSSESKRKTWCKRKAILVLESRLDYGTLEYLENCESKITDITDCLCYILAYRSKGNIFF
jgi:hypothetical protein